jgi:16S rRNA processing protein RimM
VTLSNPNGPGVSDPGPQFLVVARIIRPHGVRGDLRIQALTAFPERLADLNVVYLSARPDDTAHLIECQVSRARPDRAEFWLLHLDGIDDREAAEAYRGHYVMVSLADAVPLEADEVYLFQVMNLEVFTEEGESLGHVVDIIETGANDVFVIRGEAYGEILIPAIEQVIIRISPETGRMIVRLLPGLLPE